MPSTADDRAAAAWLCAALPELQEALDADDYALDRLQQALTVVREGGPASQVCRELGYSPDPEPDKSAVPGSTGAEVSLTDFHLAVPAVRGDYRCPRGRCGRRAHADANGREPRCVIDDVPMTFRSP